MSARNSRSAKAARRAARESRGPVSRPATSRARIAEAVHRAVCEVTGTDGYGHCALYAQAGAMTAHFITGEVHDLQAGGLAVFTGDMNHDGELTLYVDPEGSQYNGTAGGRDNGEFHAWFGPRPAGATPGTVMEVSRNGLVVADFAMRHFKRHVAEAGMPWNRAPLPTFCWGKADEIDQRLRVTYRPDVATTLLVTDKIKAMGPVPYDVSTIALRRLGCISEELARRSLSPEMLSGGWRLTGTALGGGVFTRREVS